MSRYQFTGAETGGLPTHCEKIAVYWATLIGFAPYASGRAAAMKYKAVRAFTKGLRDGGLSEEMVQQAYVDTLEIARAKIRAEDAARGGGA